MYIHPLSDVKSSRVGSGTNIWQFVVVLDGAVIGENCNICANVLIENDVIIGNNVTVKSGVYIWDGTTIMDNVFVGPCVVFCNDKYPRSKQYPSEFAKILIHENASIGANSTILPGITLGRNCIIGAGSVVTKDVPENAVVIGNPARIIKFLES
ncbi:acyltransferase [Serratia oryzae]|uniref:acyltransferase n=1 Tax=Serratia oryzae TaxID=2034155 RepID=UPI0012E222E1|nr:acyltransferase [Serratia oryzae]